MVTTLSINLCLGVEKKLQAVVCADSGIECDINSYSSEQAAPVRPRLTPVLLWMRRETFKWYLWFFEVENGF